MLVPTSLSKANSAGLIFRAVCFSWNARHAPAGLTCAFRATGKSAGKVRQAFSLDGSTGFVEIPDAPALRLVSIAFDAISSGVRGRGTALNPRRPRRAELSLNLVEAPGPCLLAL
jgi:hypothetical protein